MAILTDVGRKTAGARAVVAGIYLLLILGGITMIVPFLLTLTMAVSNEADIQRYDLLPAYWWREDLRFAKYVAEKYADHRFEIFASAYGVPEAWSAFKDVGRDPAWGMIVATLQKRTPSQLSLVNEDYQEFLQTVPNENKLPIFANWNRSAAQSFLRQKYLDQISASSAKSPSEAEALDVLSRQWNQGLFRTWDQIEFSRERRYPYHLAGWIPPVDGRQQDYLAYVKSLPAQFIIPLNAPYCWSIFLLEKGVQTDSLDKQYHTNYGSVFRIPTGDVAELCTPLATLWEEFKEKSWPERMQPEAQHAYQAFLQNKYGTIQSLNDSYGWSLRQWQDVRLPVPEVDYWDYTTHSGMYFRKMLFGNFRVIFEYVAGRGRALWNTLLLVTLSVVATLTVNPLAAYALSRFRLRATQQILVFLLATMAFPAEVGMIPGFLLLRDLHLLNTFSALILPTVANGFSIFLLKGFFDSLPPELYEAASLDGAGEMTIFWRITLPLCKPILAVIALNAFIAAYGSFMWAFLVAQDPQMWTLMVWLYQFQQTHADQPHLVVAAMVLASIPTMLVFLVCQKVILQGIVVPSMK